MPLSQDETNQITELYGSIERILSDDISGALVRLEDGRMVLLKRTGTPRLQTVPENIIQQLTFARIL